jgi:DNA-binding MarR family transcriptional regulator
VADKESDPAIRAWSHFLGAHALALRVIEERLKAANQPPFAWYDVLLELERAGGKLRIGELGERLVVEPYNVTRLLDRLESEGLLKRERAPGDGRGAFAVLSEKGAALRKKMWTHYRRAILEVFGEALSNRNAETMTAAFKKVITHLRDTAEIESPRRARSDIDVERDVERRR